MTIICEKFTVHTKGNTDIIDITQKVKSVVYNHNIKNATIIVALAGSTAGITTIEYEPGLIKDLPAIFDEIAPMDKNYQNTRSTNV